MVTKQEIPKWKCRWRQWCNFKFRAPIPQDLKNGLPIPHLALYGLEMGSFEPLFCLGSPQLLALEAAVYTPMHDY